MVKDAKINKEQINKEQINKEKINDDFIVPEGYTLISVEELHGLKEMINWIGTVLEKSKFGYYVTLMNSPFQLFIRNLGAGIARGFGFALGFTVLGALGVIILNKLAILNLPVIGDFIAQLLQYIEISKNFK